jgi:hypothetical protein
VAGTGSEDLTVGAIQSDAGGTFRYWIRDDTDGVWGSSADEVINYSNDPAGLKIVSSMVSGIISNVKTSMQGY